MVVQKNFSLQHTPKGILVQNVICSSNATRNVLENVCFLHERFLGSEICESSFIVYVYVVKLF